MGIERKDREGRNAKGRCREMMIEVEVRGKEKGQVK